MAAQPKKKHAKSRTRIRKSTKNISLPNLVHCAKCNNLKFPHKVCTNCGFYNGVKVANYEKEKRSKT